MKTDSKKQQFKAGRLEETIKTSNMKRKILNNRLKNDFLEQMHFFFWKYHKLIELLYNYILKNA